MNHYGNLCLNIILFHIEIKTKSHSCTLQKKVDKWQDKGQKFLLKKLPPKHEFAKKKLRATSQIVYNLIKNVASHHSMSSYLELSFENDRRAYRQYPQAWWAHAYIGVFLGGLRKLSCPNWGYFYFAQTIEDHNYAQCRNSRIFLPLIFSWNQF